MGHQYKDLFFDISHKHCGCIMIHHYHARFLPFIFCSASQTVSCLLELGSHSNPPHPHSATNLTLSFEAFFNTLPQFLTNHGVFRTHNFNARENHCSLLILFLFCLYLIFQPIWILSFSFFLRIILNTFFYKNKNPFKNEIKRVKSVWYLLSYKNLNFYIFFKNHFII